MKELIRNEIEGWKRWEVCWLLTVCTGIAGLSIYWKDTLMGIISSVTGVACVVCTGKGKLLAYVFGLVNSVLYAVISWQAALYGETMLNALYYVPMQFVGFYVWKKHINDETGEVEKRRMNCKSRCLLLLCIAVSTWLYGLFLASVGDAMPLVDSFTTISSVAAMLVSVRRFSEQWWIWVAVDIFSVYMWWSHFRSGNENLATLLMWIVYLGNAVIMLIKWEKEARGR